MSKLPTNLTVDIVNNMFNLHATPISIKQIALNALGLVLDEVDIVDGTNAFTFLLEAGATMSCANMLKSDSVTRQLYGKLAMYDLELYRHLSDKDYIGRFASAGKSAVKLALPLNDVLKYAVYLAGETTTRYITIPRNTIFKVNGAPMGTCYPINIEILPFNVIQCRYDISEINPLYTLDTNILKNRIVTIRNIEYLEISIPVLQFDVSSNTYPLSGFVDFTQKIYFGDSFYFARVYVNNGTGIWTEVNTTHSPIIFDNQKPTAVLKVADGVLYVSFPDVYISNGSISGAVRVDVYTTLGDMNLDLSLISSTKFSMTWDEAVKYIDTTSVAPLNKVNDLLCYSDSMLLGGRNGKTFTELKEQVIYHTTAALAPIRPSDIDIGLKTLGYSVSKYIDSVTDRLYVASKDLPLRTRNGLTTPVLASNTNVIIMPKWGTKGGSYRQSIAAHQTNRVTVKPNAIYSIDSGNVSLLNDHELTAIQTMSLADLCTYINAAKYTYSPFHYVLDYSYKTPVTRAYSLITPTISGRSFEDSNKIINYNITTDSATVAFNDGTYTLMLSAVIPNGLKNIHCQLRYIDTANDIVLYLNSVGVIYDSTAEFTFTLTSSLDIDRHDTIEFINFINSLNINTAVNLQLETVFEVFYLVDGVKTTAPTLFDDKFLLSNIMASVIGATYETITVTFGNRLNNLYVPTVEQLVPPMPLTHQQTVYSKYTDIVYEKDNNGYSRYTVDSHGGVAFIVKHNIGDTVLGSDGQPIILHNIGDPIVDSFGNALTAVSEENSKYQIGITMFNAKYKFAKASSTVAYRDAIPNVIKGYLENEIIPAAGKLAERTELLYKPMGLADIINVVLDGTQTTYISSALHFNVVYYVTDKIRDDNNIQKRITELTRNIISMYLTLNQIAISAIQKALLDIQIEGIINVQIVNFLDNNVSLVTILDKGAAFTIDEVLTVLPDGTLDVKDLVDIRFKKGD